MSKNYFKIYYFGTKLFYVDMFKKIFLQDEANEWGEIYENRTGIGVIGQVVERKADLGVSALYSWHHESRFLSLSQPISRTGITCLVNKPGWVH